MKELNQFLQIPERCLLNKKITKAFFKRNFDLTTSEKTLLDDPELVMTIDWLASISSNNANINAYQECELIFEEIQIICLQTTENNFNLNQQKITELVQKYIPYPILLCVFNKQTFILNTCDKKINKNDNSKRTIEKRYFTQVIPIHQRNEELEAFLKSLNFASLDKTNLKTLFDSYTQRIIALKTAELSGIYIPRTQSRTKKDLIYLENIEVLQNEIISLQSQAKKETQLKQQITLNTQIQMKRREIQGLQALIINT